MMVVIRWAASDIMRKWLKKEVLIQARMLENRMDRCASEMDRRIDDANRRLEKQFTMLAATLQIHLDSIVQFNTRYWMFIRHDLNLSLRQFANLPLTQ